MNFDTIDKLSDEEIYEMFKQRNSHIASCNC